MRLLVLLLAVACSSSQANNEPLADAASDNGGTAGATGGTAGTTGGTAGTSGSAGAPSSGGNGGAGADCGACALVRSCVAGECKTTIGYACNTSTCPADLPHLLMATTHLYECDPAECQAAPVSGVVCTLSEDYDQGLAQGSTCPPGSHLSLNVLDCANAGSLSYCTKN